MKEPDWSPRVGIWTPMQPRPHQRLKTCRPERIEAMKKADGLRSSRRTIRLPPLGPHRLSQRHYRYLPMA
jgi:hypothetical protein